MPDVGELLGPEVVHERGQREHDHADDDEDEQGAERGAAHTFFTSGFPKRPAGRTSSTTRITSNAVGRRRSEPMKST